MQQEDNEDAVSEVSCFRDSCQKSLFFLIIQMARGALLLSHEFDGDGRIIGDEVLQ